MRTEGQSIAQPEIEEKNDLEDKQKHFFVLKPDISKSLELTSTTHKNTRTHADSRIWLEIKKLKLGQVGELFCLLDHPLSQIHFKRTDGAPANEFSSSFNGLDQTFLFEIAAVF